MDRGGAVGRRASSHPRRPAGGTRGGVRHPALRHRFGSHRSGFPVGCLGRCSVDGHRRRRYGRLRHGDGPRRMGRPDHGDRCRGERGGGNRPALRASTRGMAGHRSDCRRCSSGAPSWWSSPSWCRSSRPGGRCASRFRSSSTWPAVCFSSPRPPSESGRPCRCRSRARAPRSRRRWRGDS